MARKPTAAPKFPDLTPADRGPVRSLEAAVAIEYAQDLVGMPIPPEIQAVLDADPDRTREARKALQARIDAAAGEPAQPTPETPPADPAEPQE